MLNRRSIRRRRETLLVFALALAVAGVSAWVLWSSDSSDIDLESTSLESEDDLDTRARRGEELNRRDSAENEGDAESQIDTAATEDALDGEEAVDAGQFRVLILNPDGQAASGARLHWRFVKRDEVTEHDRDFDRPNWTPRTPGSGVTAADAFGYVTLKRRDACLQIFARGDSAESWLGVFIERTLDRDETITMVLGSCKFVEIMILDHLGDPAADMPIGIMHVMSSTTALGDEGFYEIVHSDADGCARFGISKQTDEASAGFDALFAPAFPCTDPPTLRLAHPLRSGRIGILQLPPTAKMELRYHERDWPRDDLITPPPVVISVSRLDRDRARIPFPLLHTQRRRGAVIESGPIGLGLEFETHWSPDGEIGDQDTPSHQTFEGPRQAHDLLKKTMAPFASEQRIQGQILQSSSAPLACGIVHISLEIGEHEVSTPKFAIRLDEEGRFDAPLPAEIAKCLRTASDAGLEPDQAESLDWCLSLADRDDVAHFSPRAMITIKSALPRPATDVDLGRITPKPCACRARGRVLDEAGSPLAEVSIWHMGKGRDIFEDDMQEDFDLKTDRAGRFELRRDIEEEEGWSIYAWAPGYEACERKAPQDPEREVVIQLRRSAPLRCIVKLDDLFEGYTKTLTARAVGSAPGDDATNAGGNSVRNFQQEGDGLFELRGMRRGQVELSLQISANWSRISEVTVHREIITLDGTPAHTMDLRGRLPVCDLGVRGVGGLRRNAFICILSLGDEPLRPNANGIFRIPQALLAQSGWIVCPGHEAQAFTNRIPNGDVALGPSISRPIEFQLPDGVEITPGESHLAFWHEDTRTHLEEHQALITSPDAIRFAPNAVGTWTAWLSDVEKSDTLARARFKITELDDPTPLKLEFKIP